MTCISEFLTMNFLFQAQKHFNSVLSLTRQVIERCFALLKGRFRRLKHLCMKRLDLIPSFILACCVLHNICLYGFEENHVEEDNVDDFIEEGFQTERQLVRGNDDDDHVGLQQEGEAKRAYLVNIFERNNR